jgi:hypothetical protein
VGVDLPQLRERVEASRDHLLEAAGQRPDWLA